MESKREETPENETVSSVPFTEVRQDLPTPGKFILLRLANLTLFRNVRLGAWLRRQIVARLITNSRKGPLRLDRRVHFAPSCISFSDRITLESPMDISAAVLTRSFTAIHMGSARYFHTSSLEETPLPDTRALAFDLQTRHAATCEFRLQFSPSAKPELISGTTASHVADLQPERIPATP